MKDKFNIPRLLTMTVYVPHDEYSRACAQLAFLLNDSDWQRFKCSVVASNAPHATSLAEKSRILLESDGERFAEVYVGLSDRLKRCAWSVGIAISNFALDWHERKYGAGSVDAEVTELLEVVSFMLDYVQPLLKVVHVDQIPGKET